jgi:all-trans-8'-apo-beta-carotenal 15,15'-oxygenase
MAIADLGANCYPSEPILVPSKDHPEEGWILTVVFDGDTNSSEVRIYQSDRLADEPICRLALPSVIPPGFHGTWQQN